MHFWWKVSLVYEIVYGLSKSQNMTLNNDFNVGAKSSLYLSEIKLMEIVYTPLTLYLGIKDGKWSVYFSLIRHFHVLTFFINILKKIYAWSGSLNKEKKCYPLMLFNKPVWNLLGNISVSYYHGNKRKY